MAKLICTEHGRRVVTNSSGKCPKDMGPTTYFIHRNGDGGRCASATARLGSEIVSFMKNGGLLFKG